MILVFLASMLFVLAWRGRVIARGQFCKKCRFDLAGLAIGEPGAKCPECGRVVHDVSARRVMLRRPWRVGVVVAIAMVVVSVGLIGFGVSGKSGLLLGLLPDSAVFWVHDLGVDEALDEIVVRVSRVDEPMDDVYLSRAIEGALAHQADLEQVWDPRWGEVLAQMFGNPVMTDEQMLQYLRNGMEVEIEVRDRVHAGDQRVDVEYTVSSVRMSALNFRTTGYWYTVRPSAAGVVGEAGQFIGEHGGLSTNFMISNRTGGSRWSQKFAVVPTGIGFGVQPGSVVEVYAECELSFRGLGVAQTYRTDQPVLVIDRDEPVVPMFDDPLLAQSLCESFRISAVRVLEEIPEQNDNFGMQVLAMRIKYDGLPASIALNAYIDLGDGEIIIIGQLVQQGPSETTGSQASWVMKPYEKRDSTRYAEVIARMIERGRVDVLFKTDATLADGSPGIEEVLDLSMRFEDIPVEVYADKRQVRFVPYTQIDTLTYFNGRCEPMDPPVADEPGGG